MPALWTRRSTKQPRRRPVSDGTENIREYKSTLPIDLSVQGISSNSNNTKDATIRSSYEQDTHTMTPIQNNSGQNSNLTPSKLPRATKQDILRRYTGERKQPPSTIARDLSLEKSTVDGVLRKFRSVAHNRSLGLGRAGGLAAEEILGWQESFDRPRRRARRGQDEDGGDDQQAEAENRPPTPSKKALFHQDEQHPSDEWVRKEAQPSLQPRETRSQSTTAKRTAAGKNRNSGLSHLTAGGEGELSPSSRSRRGRMRTLR